MPFCEGIRTFPIFLRTSSPTLPTLNVQGQGSVGGISWGNVGTSSQNGLRETGHPNSYVSIYLPQVLIVLIYLYFYAGSLFFELINFNLF